MDIELPTSDAVGTQEPAWRRERIPEVVLDLARQGQAVLGGELWAFIDGEAWGSLPQQDGGPPGVWGWGCSRRPEEEWTAYCRRAAQEAIAIVEDTDFDWVDESFRPHIVINLRWCDQARFEAR